MRILIVHNYYQQRGGEDIVVETEANLLTQKGHDVRLWARNNSEFPSFSFLKKIQTLWRMPWSTASYKTMKQMVREFRPDIVHVHNTYFLITPSIYYACREEHVPVVQSIFNYRLICANALLLRDSQPCDLCVRGNRWNAVKYACYGQSRFLSGLVVRMQNTHWRKGTWKQMIDGYITSNEYNRQQHILAGIPAEKIHLKPHLIDLPQLSSAGNEGFAFYVGRLSPEKGVRVLLNAWKDLRGVPLKIMGDGPLLEETRQFVEHHQLTNVEVLGYRPDQEFQQLLSQASLLVVPSICHDNFPRTIVEAYAYGVPVLASRLSGIQEFVHDNKTGVLFEAGNVQDLVSKARWMMGHPDRLKEMGKAAQNESRTNYTVDKNYQRLMEIYTQVINEYQPHKE
jgi:glycosyltransferase involved in cell wall biosynthesis